MSTSNQHRRASIALFTAGLLLTGLSVLVDWNQIATTVGLTDQIAAYGQQFVAVSGLAILLTATLYSLHTRYPLALPAAVLCQGGWPPYLLAVAMLLYVAAFGLLVFQRHYHFNSGTYDLGLQSQVVWNTAHGQWYASSVEVSNYLGDHFQPLVAILAPLYWIEPSIYWLLAFQTVVLATGAIPVYYLAKHHLGCSLYGLLFGVLYLLYPSVGYINRFDFHWEATAIPFLLAAIAAADRHSWRWASVWIFLALLGKEEIGLTVAAFGLWIAWRLNRRFGLTWFLVGLSFSIIALFSVIPAMRGASSDTLVRYMWLGATPREMLRNIVLHPQLVAPRLLGIDTLRLVVSLTGPLMFLPLFSSITIVILPALAYNLLSDVFTQRVAYYQYMAPIIPFIFAGAIFTTRRAFAWAKRHSAPWAIWSICGSLILFTLWHGAVVNNPLVDDGSVMPAWYRLPNEQAMREALVVIPPYADVLTTNYYGAHLSQRPILRVMIDPRDYSLFTGVEFALFNTIDYRNWACQDYTNALEEAARLGYGLRFYQDHAVVIQRHGGDPQQLQMLLKTVCKALS